MGRGGGGGGSHHSSHHSSSHSHHSSGSSYHSSRSSYSHSSRSNARLSGSRYGGSSYGGSRGNNGCLGGFVRFFAAFIFIFVFAFIFLINLRQDISVPMLDYFLIERSTENREALPESKCTPVDNWYQDDWGDWINEQGEEKSLINGLVYFYEKTGVQPYLWITGEDGQNYKYQESVEQLADEKYKELFGDDEGHLIVIFREYPNASSDYICTVTPGYDAETQVMDEQAREILLDYIDYYYTNDELNEGEFFRMAFIKAGDRIMMKQLSFRQMGTIVAVAVILVIGVIIAANIIKKRKVAVAKQKADQAKAEANKAQTRFEQQKYQDHLETQFVAVTCPNCGASGNKIRMNTVGFCQYCGTAIKVDENGFISVESGSDTDT